MIVYIIYFLYNRLDKNAIGILNRERPLVFHLITFNSYTLFKSVLISIIRLMMTMSWWMIGFSFNSRLKCFRKFSSFWMSIVFMILVNSSHWLRVDYGSTCIWAGRPKTTHNDNDDGQSSLMKHRAAAESIYLNNYECTVPLAWPAFGNVVWENGI